MSEFERCLTTFDAKVETTELIRVRYQGKLYEPINFVCAATKLFEFKEFFFAAKALGLSPLDGKRICAACNNQAKFGVPVERSLRLSLISVTEKVR